MGGPGGVQMTLGNVNAGQAVAPVGVQVKDC
jgi:hypothetical protein